MAVASLILGIISIVCGVFGLGLRLGGAVLAVVGIVLSTKGTNAEKKSMAKAGRACSVTGLIICLCLFLASVVCAQIFHTVVGANLLEELLKFVKELTV